MEIPSEITLEIFFLSFDFRSPVLINKSITILKLVCKSFKKIVESESSLIFWKRIYAKLEWKEEFKTLTDVTSSFHPRSFFSKYSVQMDDDEKSLYFCGNEKIIYTQYNETVIFNGDNE